MEMKTVRQPMGIGIVCIAALLVRPGQMHADGYREAPMVRVMVEQGILPPIGKRLPDQPMVVRPYAQVGQYGGQMRVVTGEVRTLQECEYLLMTPLLRFAADGKTIVPNVARHWEMSADGKVFTIHLRRGMKWSDGAPVTVRDAVFAWEDVLLNVELTPVPPVAFCVGGKPMVLEPVDDHSFRMVFVEPFGALPYFLTRTQGFSSLLQPSHYLKRFHRRYTPVVKLEAMARERGLERWYELFHQINHTRKAPSSQMPPDYPTLAPWLVSETPATGHVILRRNPYHWQVDTEGNQLPYIDEIHSQWVGNPEARNLKFVSGEIDFGMVYVRFDNAPLFLGNQEAGGYRLFFWKENQGTRVAYYFNQTHEDPEKRALFQDRRFRIALSHAINRGEINDVVYYGQCLPRQDTVNRVCSFFETAFETVHMMYDPEKAERMLDALGLMRRGIGGWRVLPSGKTLAITLDVFPVEPYAKTAELIREYWQSVGVLLNCRTVQGSLNSTRIDGNKHDVAGHPNDCATDVMVINNPVYEMALWAPLWVKWLTASPKGRQGERPPQHIRDLYDVWVRLRRTTDDEERVRLGKRIIQYQADNLLGIGTVGETLNPIIVSNRLHNVPKWMVDADGQPIEGRQALSGWPWLASFLHHPEQWFLNPAYEAN